MYRLRRWRPKTCGCATGCEWVVGVVGEWVVGVGGEWVVGVVAVAREREARDASYRR
jgi:hypothetical protein